MAMDKQTLSTLARELNVSVTTISRVLHNKPDVKAATRQKVLAHIQRRGYHLSITAADLNLIGIVDTFKRHRLSSYYTALLLEGIDDTFYPEGYLTTLVHTELVEKEQSAYGHVKLFNQLCGIIWLEPAFDRRYLAMVAQNNIPCVVINSCEPDLAVDIVECNSFNAAKTATEYLIGLGHRHIAFIGGQFNYSSINDRVHGYREALAEADIAPNPTLIIEDIAQWNDEGGAEGVYRLYSKQERPTAILVSSDFLIAGVYRAIKDLKLTIPGDVSVISFDDSPLAAYLDPPVTSCQQPLKEIGARAAQRLVRLMAMPPAERTPEKQTVKMPFVVRRSTRRIS